MIIGITGPLGAGKTTVASLLVSKGFIHYSVRSFIAEEVKKRGLPVNRDTLVSVGNDLRAERGAAYIVGALCDRAKAGSGDAVIESIRAVGDAQELRCRGGFLLAVTADPALRHRRLIDEGSLAPASFEEFVAQDEREMMSSDPTKQSIGTIMHMADYNLYNNGTLAALDAELSEVLERIAAR